LLLAFEGLERPVALIDCDELAAGITVVLRGWRIEEVVAKSCPAPAITIRGTEGGYRRESEWLSNVLPRLRLPLCDQEGESFHRFVGRRCGPASESYLYVELTEEELAPRGTKAPIEGIVLLGREPAARTLRPNLRSLARHCRTHSPASSGGASPASASRRRSPQPVR